jgi:hypothetical protein
MRAAREREIAAAVKRAERKLKPDVVRIRFNPGFDWTGDPSVFFRIVFSDDATRGMAASDHSTRSKDADE